MLLPHRKRVILERIYAWYGRRLLRGGFTRVRVGGERWPDEERPSIALLNHSAWWDPILALFLSHDLFRRDGYGIMEGEQLLRYPFFQRIGCFGATGESLDDTRAVAAEAQSLLRGHGDRTLWLFPQGALLPARAAMRFRSGAARISRGVPDALLVPIAVRYEPGPEQRPECVVRVGRATDRGTDGPVALTRRLEALVSSELQQLDCDVAEGRLDRYPVVLRGRGSVASLYDRTIGALLRPQPAPERH